LRGFGTAGVVVPGCQRSLLIFCGCWLVMWLSGSRYNMKINAMPVGERNL